MTVEERLDARSGMELIFDVFGASMGAIGWALAGAVVGGSIGAGIDYFTPEDTNYALWGAIGLGGGGAAFGIYNIHNASRLHTEEEVEPYY